MTVSQQAIDAAAEATEDAALRWLGRDLGTLHRNEIVEAGLLAAEPFMRAGCYICQPENPNAAEEGCDRCDAEASMYRHAEVLRTQLAALTAQLQTVRVATIRECVEAVERQHWPDKQRVPQCATCDEPHPCWTLHTLLALLDAAPTMTAEQPPMDFGYLSLPREVQEEIERPPATTAGEDDGVGFANDEMEAAYVVQPDAAATCGHTFHYWHDGVRYWSQGEHHSTRFPCPASTDDGTDVHHFVVSWPICGERCVLQEHECEAGGFGPVVPWCAPLCSVRLGIGREHLPTCRMGTP